MEGSVSEADCASVSAARAPRGDEASSEGDTWKGRNKRTLAKKATSARARARREEREPACSKSPEPTVEERANEHASSSTPEATIPGRVDGGTKDAYLP